jgi:urease accessory protein
MDNERSTLAGALPILVGVVTLGPAGTLFAHETGDVAGGFVAGITHPLFGLDHVAAMVAVGLWGGQLRQPAMWLLPVTFPIIMAMGGVLGARGVPIPAVEIAIAVSAIVLGIMVAASVKPPLWVAAALVGAFAVFHGHAHGTELPESATPLAYGAGFVISTGLLHATGILVGLLVYWPAGEKVVRLCGGVISCVGLYFLAGCFSG